MHAQGKCPQGRKEAGVPPLHAACVAVLFLIEHYHRFYNAHSRHWGTAQCVRVTCKSLQGESFPIVEKMQGSRIRILLSADQERQSPESCSILLRLGVSAVLLCTRPVARCKSDATSSSNSSWVIFWLRFRWLKSMCSSGETCTATCEKTTFNFSSLLGNDYAED